MIRVVTISRKGALALDRYLRERTKQKWADSPSCGWPRRTEACSPKQRP